MAVIADQNQDQDDENSATSASPGVTSSSNSSGGGSSSTNSQGGGNSPTTTSAPASSGGQGASSKTSGQGSSNYATPTTSGTFTNLQNYLNANKNYDSSQGGFAGQTYNNLSNQGQQLNNSVNSADTQFNTQSQAGANAYNANTINNDLANPNATVGNTAAYNQFEQSLTGGYTGPTALNNASQLQNQTQNYQNLTGLANNSNGRYALLQQMYGSPTYTSGQQNLDNMLLQSNPSQLQTLQSATQLGNAANNNLTNVNNNVNQAVQQYQQQAANTNAQTAAALNNTETGFTTNLNQALANLQNQYNTQVTNANQELSSDNISPALASQLGLTSGTVLYNINPDSYLNQTAPTLSLNNIATQNDVNTANALDKLGNNSNLSSLNLNPTAAPSALNFNNAAFQNALTQAQNQYNAAFNATTLPGNQSLADIANNSIPMLEKQIANGGSTTVNGATVTGNLQQEQAELAAQQAELQNFYKQQGLNNILQANAPS